MVQFITILSVALLLSTILTIVYKIFNRGRAQSLLKGKVMVSVALIISVLFTITSYLPRNGSIIVKLLGYVFYVVVLGVVVIILKNRNS